MQALGRSSPDYFLLPYRESAHHIFLKIMVKMMAGMVMATASVV